MVRHAKELQTHNFQRSQLFTWTIFPYRKNKTVYKDARFFSDGIKKFECKPNGTLHSWLCNTVAEWFDRPMWCAFKEYLFLFICFSADMLPYTIENFIEHCFGWSAFSFQSKIIPINEESLLWKWNEKNTNNKTNKNRYNQWERIIEKVEGKKRRHKNKSKYMFTCDFAANFRFRRTFVAVFRDFVIFVGEYSKMERHTLRLQSLFSCCCCSSFLPKKKPSIEDERKMKQRT